MPAWWVPEGSEGVLPGGPLCRPTVRLRTGAKVLQQSEISRVWKRESALEEVDPVTVGLADPRVAPERPLASTLRGLPSPWLGRKWTWFQAGEPA